MVGTPHYLSPEQALGHPATGASDLYALGIVAHEMLTGRRPFDSGSAVATALAQVHDAPPPLPADVPEAVSYTHLDVYKRQYYSFTYGAGGGIEGSSDALLAGTCLLYTSRCV